MNRDIKVGKLKNNESESANNGDRSSTQDSGDFAAFVASTRCSQLGSKILVVGNCLRDFTEAGETESWILDSCASCPVCCHREWFSELTSCGNGHVYLGDGLKHEVRGISYVFVERLLNGKLCDGVINNVLYVPTLQENLLSTGVCMQLGQRIQLSGECSKIFSKGRILIVKGVRQSNDLMRLLFRSSVVGTVNYTSAAALKLWHERLWHVKVGRIKAMLRSDSITGVS